jgi:ADP-ribosylglycohydrolase
VLCQAILRKGGRVTPDDYAAAWLEWLDPARVYVTEQIILAKLELGMDPWSTGAGHLRADAAVMAIAPVGVVNAGAPAQAYQDGYTLARMHQDGLECEAAATVAAGVAVAVVPGATAGDVLETMGAHCSFEVDRLLRMASELASGTVDDFVEAFYATMLDRSFPLPPGAVWDKDRSHGPTSREVLPAVAGLLALCEGDANRCLIEGASFGRDADTIATVLGGIAGALSGASAIRPDWIEDCERANAAFLDGTSFAEVADGLLDVLAAERDAARGRFDFLGGLL